MNQISWGKKFIPVREGASLEEYQGRRDNVLVISPHPDDDVLAVGGTMVDASIRGKGVFSVYITDGRSSPRLDPSISDEEMVQRREKEALAALRTVGGVGGFFLRKQSTELEGEGEKEVENELVEIIQWITPQEVYLPAPYERHGTHQRCTRLAIQALRAGLGVKPALWGYSLWGCFWGRERRVVRDISAHIQKKVEAVLAHSTQIAYKNYQQGILGKNNYEAIFWETHEPQKMGFAEIFLDLSELLEKRDLTLADFIRQDVDAFIRTFL